MRSPAKEALDPVNEKNGSGTGIGTLMPTWVWIRLKLVNNMQVLLQAEMILTMDNKTIGHAIPRKVQQSTTRNA